MRNSKGNGRTVPKQFTVESVNIREIGSVAKIRESRVANDAVNFLLRSLLNFTVRDKEMQERTSRRRDLMR
jgi:hypothetical protein